jgi:hypothetical protein
MGYKASTNVAFQMPEEMNEWTTAVLLEQSELHAFRQTQVVTVNESCCQRTSKRMPPSGGPVVLCPNSLDDNAVFRDVVRKTEPQNKTIKKE